MFYFFGDLHGSIDFNKCKKSSLKTNGIKLTNKDVAFQLGDFGLLWYLPTHSKNKEQQYYLNMLKHYPCDILITPGNHENWDLIEQLPVVEKYGSTMYQLSDNIFFMQRGNIYNIQNKTFFSFGGATSIDKHRRIEGISWWPQEVHEVSLEYKTLDIIDNIGKVDYILTHTPPKQFVNHILCHQGLYTHSDKSKCPVAVFLEEVYNRLQFNKWLCGHMHVDGCWVKDKRVICLYNNVGVENAE